MERRLTLAVPSLQYGGAERVAAAMANHWSGRGAAVSVVTLSNSTDDTYPLDPSVTRIALGAAAESRGPIRAIANNTARIRRLREAIADSKPDTVIGLTDRMNVLTVLACRPLGVDVVISERANPALQKIGRSWSWLRRRTYPLARALVVQTQRVRAQMEHLMRGRPIYVIPNFVLAPAAEPGPHPPSESRGAHQILAVGRLHREKGFDILIDAFAQVAARHPSWSLSILGEGPERAELERMVQGRGLSGRIRLPGWEPDPVRAMRASDLFVLSSRHEGFPNALLEAMASGVPAISFDCECGPAEIIRDGIDGILVPPADAHALAAAIDRAIADANLRDRLAQAAEQVVERFSADRHFARWEAVLRKEPPEHVDRL